MSEVLIFPEMIEAGIEQLTECRDKGLQDEQTVVYVFLAMQGFLEMQRLRGGFGECPLDMNANSRQSKSQTMTTRTTTKSLCLTSLRQS